METKGLLKPNNQLENIPEEDNQEDLVVLNNPSVVTLILNNLEHLVAFLLEHNNHLVLTPAVPKLVVLIIPVKYLMVTLILNNPECLDLLQLNNQVLEDHLVFLKNTGQKTVDQSTLNVPEQTRNLFLQVLAE